MGPHFFGPLRGLLRLVRLHSPFPGPAGFWPVHSPTQRPLSTHHCVLVGQRPLPQHRSTFVSLYLHRDREKTSHSRRNISLPIVIWLYYNANSNSVYIRKYKIVCILENSLFDNHILLTLDQYTWTLSLNIFPMLCGCFSDVQISHMAA